jgi:hypothetical protein
MIEQEKSHAPTLRPTQDLKRACCESKAMLKMMLEKEWSCNLFEMPFWNQYEPLFTYCMKKGMQNHHIQNKKLPQQPQVGLERKWT